MLNPQLQWVSPPSERGRAAGAAYKWPLPRLGHGPAVSLAVMVQRMSVPDTVV